jgi:hypothetical protein
MDLTRRATSRTGRAEDARRARVILLPAVGDTDHIGHLAFKDFPIISYSEN